MPEFAHSRGTYNRPKNRLYVSLPHSTGVDIMKTEVDDNGIEWEISYTGRRLGFFIHNIEIDCKLDGENYV